MSAARPDCDGDTRDDRDGGPALAYFDALFEAFTSAARAAGTVERRYAIGPLVVCLRFAGAALVAAVTPALAHLEVADEGAPHVTIGLLDRASTGARLPRPPWGAEDYGPRGAIRGFNDGRIRTVYDGAARALWIADLARARALFCIAAAHAIPSDERAAPLRPILHWLTSAQGYQLVHAAAVGRPDGGVLLAGRGGSGKSTAALACVGSELRYAGDDYVLVDGRAPAVYSVYNTARLHGEQMARFPALLACVDNGAHLATEKALLFLARHDPGALAPVFPIRALLLPRVTGARRARIVPASPLAALAALAPTTVLQLPGDGARTFAALAALVRQVPSYWLELGGDVRRIPEVIAEVLRLRRVAPGREGDGS